MCLTPITMIYIQKYGTKNSNFINWFIAIILVLGDLVTDNFVNFKQLSIHYYFKVYLLKNIKRKISDVLNFLYSLQLYQIYHNLTWQKNSTKFQFKMKLFIDLVRIVAQC